MMLSEKSKLQAEGLHGIWYHLYDILNAKYYVFSDLIYMVEESKAEGRTDTTFRILITAGEREGRWQDLESHKEGFNSTLFSSKNFDVFNGQC